MKERKNFVKNGVGTILPEISEMFREGVRRRNEKLCEYEDILNKIAKEEKAKTTIKNKLKNKAIYLFKFSIGVFIGINILIGMAIFIDSLNL